MLAQKLIVLTAGLTLTLAALTFCAVVGQRRTFPDDIGSIVFEMSYQDSAKGSMHGTRLNVEQLQPNNIWMGEQFDTLLNPLSALHVRFVDDLDCAPDGQSLLISSQYLYRLAVSDKALHQLTPATHLIWALASSPDGRQIAFTNVTSSQYAIFTANADGSNAIQFLGDQALETSLSWSPDGTQIAFSTVDPSGPDEQYRINAVDLATRKVRLLYQAASTLSHVSWSPDGSRILFQMADQISSNIYTIQPNGSQLTRLTYQFADNADPRWSPDGSLISYSALDSSGHFQLYVMNADGGDAHPVFVAPLGQDAFNVCWLKPQSTKG